MEDEIDDSQVFKWEVQPHPNNKDFDYFVCDDDQEALRAALAATEAAWDQMEDGEEKIIVIRRNKVPQADGGSEHG